MLKKNRILLTLFLVTIIFGSTIPFWQKTDTLGTPPKAGPSLRANPYCQTLFKDADGCISSQTRPPFHYVIQKGDGPQDQKIIGYIVLTENFAPEIRGYSGMIKMALGVSRGQKIRKAVVLTHSETPSYTASINEYVQQFRNKPIDQAFEIGKGIDAMTGATISSQAIVRSINQTLRRFRDILNQEETQPLPATNNPINGVPLVLIVILFGAALLSLYFPKLNLRAKILFASFLYLGLIESTMFSVMQILNLMFRQAPPFVNDMLTYSLLGLMAGTLLIWGNIYCGYICPFAGVQDFLFTVRQKLPWRNRSASSRNTHRSFSDPGALKSTFYKAHIIRYIILIGTLGTGIIIGSSQIANIEVFILFFTQNASLLGWVFVSCILIFSLFYQRFWCKFLCPAGACNGLVSLLSWRKVRIIQDSCRQCQRCVTVCPMDAFAYKDDQLIIDHAQCILCGECLKQCPHNAISYK
jgi:NAD-dependent dihydropyrimidine dehydrogenase PreA subunit